MSQHDLMTRLSSYSSFLTTVHSANSTQEQPVIFCLKSSSNLSKSASTTLHCCGGQLTMLSARINYLHSVSGIIIIITVILSTSFKCGTEPSRLMVPQADCIMLAAYLLNCHMMKTKHQLHIKIQIWSQLYEKKKLS